MEPPPPPSPPPSRACRVFFVENPHKCTAAFFMSAGSLWIAPAINSVPQLCCAYSLFICVKLSQLTVLLPLLFLFCSFVVLFCFVCICGAFSFVRQIGIGGNHTLSAVDLSYTIQIAGKDSKVKEILAHFQLLIFC